MNRTHPKVDKFFSREKKWWNEMERLRAIVLDCGLAEELKWGQPCYTFRGKNILIIHGFKEYCALLFVKGALMHDPHGILIRQTEQVQAGRQIRFRHLHDIMELEPILKAYIFEAIEVEKAGLKIVHKRTEDYTVPEEFQRELAHEPTLKKAFQALTPGRQRGYLLYFAQPKQYKTREARIEKYRSHILDGKGLND